MVEDEATLATLDHGPWRREREDVAGIVEGGA